MLKEILSIPSFVRKETMVRDYIIKFAISNNIPFFTDEFGNVFLRKGNGTAPCVVAHMDTVHRDQSDMVDDSENILINEVIVNNKTLLYGQRLVKHSQIPVNTGCGGDDKAGIFIALSIILELDNIIGFFPVEEEVGCVGSKNVIHGEGKLFLENVSYFIQFDAPTDDWISRICSGIELFDNTFANILKPIWDKYNLSEPHTSDPFTDVKELKKHYPVCCINYFAGYMDMHSPTEYVVVEYVEKAINLGLDTIKILGNKKHIYNG